MDVLGNKLNNDCEVLVCSYLDFDDVKRIFGCFCNDKVWKMMVKRDFPKIYVSRRMLKKYLGWYGVYNILNSGLRWIDIINL